PQGRHRHLSLPASAAVGARDSDAIPSLASAAHRGPTLLGPYHTASRPSRTTSPTSPRAPLLSRTQSMEIFCPCPWRVSLHQIILAAMALNLDRPALRPSRG